MVPAAEFGSYYGRPVLKAPVWTHDVPAYLFTGGLAAGSSLLAAGGDLTGTSSLRRAGRATSMAALLVSAFLLVRDLGRPERFLNMLRVVKPTSPMSIGSWIITAYGGAASVAAASEVARSLAGRGRLGPPASLVVAAGRPAGLAAAAVSPALATYTAVLLADTAVPSWHEAHPQLPFLFAGSALASGVGVGLIAASPAHASPARRMAVMGAALDLAATRSVRHRMGLLSEPYTTGRAGRLLHAGEVLTASGAAAAVVGRRSRALSVVSGACLLGGSMLTRFGIFEGGVVSTEDPKYVVVPQRQRQRLGRTVTERRP
jgi:Polysulphide reductase, NrfD